MEKKDFLTYESPVCKMTEIAPEGMFCTSNFTHEGVDGDDTSIF